jgi:tetratricopeptide (TPR) repeat protein
MKSYSILFIFLLIGMLTSCTEEWLEITPKNEKTEATFFQDEDDAIAAITAAYVPVKMAGLFANDIQFFYYSFDNFIKHENATWETFTFQANASRIPNVYYDLCRGVFRCNYAIMNIQDLELEKEIKSRLIAEAKFLRAFYYFYQTIIFNEPPLVKDEVFKEYGVQRPNSPRSDFYQAIIEDLEEAIEVLPLDYPDTQVGRATRGAALALLGKAYLYKASYAPSANVSEDYTNAQKYLKQVMESGVYDLSMPQGTDSADYVNAYLCNFSYRDLKAGDNVYKAEYNQESIFEAPFNQDPNMENNRPWWPGITNGGSLIFMYFGPVDSWLNIAPQAEFVARFEKAESHPAGLEYDPRRAATFFFEGDYVGFSPIRNDDIYFDPKYHTKPHITNGVGLRKYYFPLHEDNGSRWPFNYPNNWRVLRYADVLLMYAEASYMLNQPGEARLAINKVRERAGMPVYENDGEIGPEVIMQERDVELGGECIHFHDLVRWSMMESPWVDIESVIPHFKKGKSEFMPIPLNEVLAMEGLLKQNPGY